jgi:hypothetical protein
MFKIQFAVKELVLRQKKAIGRKTNTVTRIEMRYTESAYGN